MILVRKKVSGELWFQGRKKKQFIKNERKKIENMETRVLNKKYSVHNWDTWI